MTTGTVEAGISVSRSGSGPAVLVLHGFPETKAMWRDVAPALATEFTVVRADLRGYGDSGWPPSAPIGAAPEAVTANAFSPEWGTPADTVDDHVRAHYTAQLADPEHLHAICEEYRAAATIDREHDKADRRGGRRIACPVLVRWNGTGPLATWYDEGPLALWREIADDVRGGPAEGGHFFPEEFPARTAAALAGFFGGRA